MDENAKQRQKAQGPSGKSTGSGSKAYWLIFVILAVVVVGIVLQLCLNHQNSRPGHAQVTSVVLQGQPNEPDVEANLPVAGPVAASHDLAELDIPLPEDVEALVRYYSTDGPKRLGDAMVIWQKRQDGYIDFLEEEVFERGLDRSYMRMELVFVIGNFPNSDPSYAHHITLQARTRRFAKLLAHVRQAKERGEVEAVIETIHAAVKRFTQARRRTTELIEQMMQEEPENFRLDSPEDQRRKVNKLLYGFGVTALDVPEGVIPMSLKGTQLGVVVSTFLLGFTEHPRAIRTLLDIVAYDDEHIITSLTEAIGAPQELEWMRQEFTFENRVVLADALDRIMIACLRDRTINPEALAVAQQYSQWRRQQDFPDRDCVDVVVYDSPKTPHHLPGYVAGVKADEVTGTIPLELPLKLIRSRRDVLPNEELIAPIIDFAHRFNNALSREKRD